MEHLPDHVRKHVDFIAEQERAFHQRKTRTEHVSHAIGGFVGSIPFVLLHVVWFGVWLLLNTLPALHHFDAFPFPLLGIIIEIEGIFLASFILMRQNRMNRRSDEREHLILQVLLLAEQEVTTLIDIERRKSIREGHTDIALDRTVASFAQPTSVDRLTQTLQENLPPE